MANSRVNRGRETEALVAAYLRSHGWINAERVPASLPGRDINGVLGVAIEVKARRDFHPREWVRQAIKNAAEDLPVVVMRPDGMGEASVGEWPVLVRLVDFVMLLKDAGYLGDE